MRELDRLCIDRHGIAGYELMQRAGLALFKRLMSRYPEARSLAVCCGAGNNAGDGYVVARLALQQGLGVRLIALSDPNRLSGDAAQAARDFLHNGGEVLDAAVDLEGCDVIVDALLGTGLDREVQGEYLEWIERMNESRSPVIAVDIPSGLNADTGMPMNVAVRADLTVSFIGQKRGLHTGMAADYVGELVFDTLAAPDAVYASVPPDAAMLHESQLADALPPRLASTHKGKLGHVLVAGSDFNMPGAVLLAAKAALMTGSGLVSVATRCDHAFAMAGSLPEAMWANGEDFDRLDQLLKRADVVALGPGLGDSEWSLKLWHRLANCDLPIVLDADGLNHLTQAPRQCRDWVLTPHPGEAARLLKCSVAEIQQDRFAAVRALAGQYCAVVVLKGAGSLIASSAGDVRVCPYGNPAMATAGMGDALTGIIASLLGQGLDAFDAAWVGVLLHALAGDRAAQNRRQILTSELIAALPEVLPE